MIIPRPLKRVLGKIIPFSQEDKIPTFNLGSGTADYTTYLRGDGLWSTITGVPGTILKGTASGVDTYTSTISGVSSYTDGDAYLIRFTTGNTTGCSLDINSLGAKTLYRNNDGALIGGDIVDGAEMFCIYNSTLNGFQLIGTSNNTLISYVTNAESVTITKGQPVYAFGGQGDRLKVKLAYNTSDATSAQTVGLVLSSSIGANQKGFIILNGLLDGLSILPTSTYADGDAIYLGATAGSITNVKPSAPNHLVYLGFVTTASNGSAGRMYVRVQNGYEMDELHDVAISSLTNGQILQYESATSLWKNVTPSSGGLTVGTTGITSGTAGRVLFEDATNKLNQSANFYWDNSNSRISFGNGSSPGARVDIRAAGALSTDLALRIRNSANSADLMKFSGDGTLTVNTSSFSHVINNRLSINSNLTGTGGGLYVYAGNSGDYIARFHNSVGTPVIDFRTNADGGEIYMKDNSGNLGMILGARYSTAINMYGGKNIAFATTTGTRIGEATNQMFSFWNKTPIVQPTTAIAAATFVMNTSLIANDTATFDGYTIGQVVKALRNVGLLA